jgi:bifunctional DNA-binding transcriptional regulator/antitoxin component of YhaV-PrlF toxin-antitoxin module
MTVATARLSSKRQLTLPAMLREILGVEAGGVVAFRRDRDSGQIFIERAQTLDESADYFTSLIKPNTKPVTDVHKYIEENWNGRL